MHSQTFSGNFFEIGKQQGKIYAKNKMSFKHVKIDKELYKKQLTIYKKFYPELLSEFEGMAQAGNFDKDKLIYQFITAELRCYRDWFELETDIDSMSDNVHDKTNILNRSNNVSKLNLSQKQTPGKACTIFGYKKDGKLFVGRNYDWLPKTEKIFTTYTLKNPERNSFIAVTDGGYGSEAGNDIKNVFYNVNDAINNKGLFIGLTFAYNDKWSYGLSCVHICKLIAETCSTVKDAIKVFEKIPVCCPKNFFIADKNGDMIVIEHTSQQFKILYPKNDILIQTNNYIDAELAKEDTALKSLSIHNTFIRYHETFQRIHLYENKFNINKIITILGKKGTYVCQNFPGIKTIWTLALDMTNKKYKLYHNLFGKRKERMLKV